MNGRPLPGAVELPFGRTRLTPDEFAELVLRPAAGDEPAPADDEDDDGRA